MSRFWWYLAVAVCLLPAASPAATFLVQNDEFYIRNSEVVITGTVLGSHVVETPGGRGHRTITEISVKDVLKGGLRPGSTVQVATLGGALDGKAWIVPGEATFAGGEEVLLLLVRDKYGDLRPMDLVLGKFTRVMSTAGEALLVRDADVIFGWTPSGSEHREPVRREEAFLRFVREVAAGRGAQRDYLAPATTAFPPAGRDGRRNLRLEANFAPTSYSMLATIDFTPGQAGGEVTRGCRWPTFGNGETFFNSNTLPQAPNGGVNGIIAGTAMWTSDCPSAIQYSYGGTTGTTQCLFGNDGINGVSFNDPCGDVPGTYPGTTSTLAQGAFLANSTTTTVEGEQFWDIVEGNVVVNDGVGNWPQVGNAAFFNAMMAHELGHTLAFRHSDQTNAGNPAPSCSGNAAYDCSSSAVMKATLSTAHTSLQAWDQAAAVKLYPGGSCGGGPKGDLNNDGRSDLFLRNTSSGQTTAWLMNGASIADAAHVYVLPSPAWQIAGQGDFNGDNKADILLWNSATGQTTIWFMNGTALINGEHVYLLPSLSWRVEAVGDFNGDNRSDIFLRNISSGQAVVWLMNGATISESTTVYVLPSTSWEARGAGDLNGDGRDDLIFRNSATGQVVGWFMNGTAIADSAHIYTLPDGNWNISTIADFNGDAKADLVLRNSATGAVVLWTMNGFVIADSVLVYTLPGAGIVIEASGDFNGDTKADLILRNTANSQVILWQMNGATIVDSSVVYTLPDPTWSVQQPR